MSVRAANIARKNATFAPLGESLWTGPGGASKKPACAGPGGAACPELSSSIFSRRALSSRSRASSVAAAAGISATRTPYATRSWPWCSSLYHQLCWLHGSQCGRLHGSPAALSPAETRGIRPRLRSSALRSRDGPGTHRARSRNDNEKTIESGH